MFYVTWELWINLKMICFQNGDKIVLLFRDKTKNLFSYMWKINRKYWDLMIILSAWVWKSDVLLFLCDLLLCTMKDYVTDQINALTQVQAWGTNEFIWINYRITQTAPSPKAPLQQDDVSQNVVPGAPWTTFRQLHKRSSPPVPFSSHILPLIRTTYLTRSCKFLEFPY